MGIIDSKRPHLISPFAKKTNIHCSLDDDNNSSNSNTRWGTQHKELYRVHHTDDEDSGTSTRSIVLEKSRKRRSDGSLIPPPPLSISIARHDSPLPPLPTVENFLTILNAPASPDSSYFSARSASSAFSSQSTLNSILLDDVANHLASTHIMEPCRSSESSSSSSSSTSTIGEKKHDSDDDTMTVIEQKPPPVPPKDHVQIQSNRLLKMDPQDNTIMNINNKQEKRRIMAKPAEMRITTSDIPKSQYYASPKSADVASGRPPIPPRRSSMPIPLPPSKQPLAAVPPLPVDAKKKARPAKTLLDER
jgi:hypothetical protein